MLMDQKELAQKIDSLSREIKHFPSGNIFYSYNGKSLQWYQYVEHSKKLIPSKELELKKELIMKKYLCAKLEEVKLQEKATEAYLSVLERETAGVRQRYFNTEKILSSKEYSLYLTDAFKILEKDLQAWKEAPYEKSNQYPENLIHKSMSGNLLRSKSESMIDMLLYTNQIPYHYEEILHLPQLTIVPDFTIIHPKTRKIMYWEHFGMIDNPEYFQKYMKKLEVYTQNEIYPGNQLIMTFETKEKPLTLEEIDKVIQKNLTNSEERSAKYFNY